MNSFILKTLYTAQDIFVHPYILRAIRELKRTNDPAALLVSESIQDAFYRRTSKHDAAIFSTIEDLRATLASSNEEIEIVDFGARASSLDGVIVHRTLREIALKASKPKRWASLLFYLVKRLQPVRCLEFGTCVGISSLYQSAALSLNGKGSIVTMEGSESLAAIAQRNFDDLKCSNIIPRIGRFDAILDDVLKSYQPFDFIFVDGHHDRNFTLHYFEKILPCISRSTIVIIDDIRWSKGMMEAWHTLEKHPRVKIAVDLHQCGIIIVA